MMPHDEQDAPHLFADLQVDRGVLTARLVGPSIGLREGPVIAEMIESRLDGDTPVAWIVLDFSDVSYINSAGIGSCIKIRNDGKAREAGVVMHLLSDNLKEVFKMTKLDKIFKMTDDDKRLAKVTGRK